MRQGWEWMTYTEPMARTRQTEIFFLLSIFLEITLNRSRFRQSRPIRDADGEYINKSDYAGAPPQRRSGGKGFPGAFRRWGAG